MKSPLFYLFCLAGAFFCFGGIGCEMHSPSETVKGYDKHEHAEATPAPRTGETSPTYFPPKQ